MTGSVLERVETCDVLVIGAGVAGLAAALACEADDVRLLTGGPVGRQGASALAQGGVAAALGSLDSVAAHARDTVLAGDGLVDAEVAARVTEAAPGEIARLVAHGVAFDRDDNGDLILGREAAHQAPRIVHARGDATGIAISRALGRAAERQGRIHIDERARARDLILSGGRVVGARVVRDGDSLAVAARAVVLCTGGSGRIFSETTQPPSSRGEGLAMAARAGASLVDLEFVQFHPTVLDVEADPRPLLTEALRGAGALLIDGRGRRFMTAVDPRGELAPRDVVARAIARLAESGERAYLDARRAVGAEFPRRFPTVFESCRRHGLDPRREPIPVRPAAHYHMGGVATDGRGRTSLPGLWAAGEVACTGLHGANRLASNSLLECLVFGRRAGRDAGAEASAQRTPLFEATMGERAPSVARRGGPAVAESEAPRVEARVRETMSTYVGVVRDGVGLDRACRELDGLEAEAAAAGGATHALWTVARLVAGAARARVDSRGSHHRSDAVSAPRRGYRLVWDGTKAHGWDDFEAVEWGEESRSRAEAAVEPREVTR